MPLLGEATHPSCKVQHPSRPGIRKDAEQKLEGVILNYMDL